MCNKTYCEDNKFYYWKINWFFYQKINHKNQENDSKNNNNKSSLFSLNSILTKAKQIFKLANAIFMLETITKFMEAYMNSCFLLVIVNNFKTNSKYKPLKTYLYTGWLIGKGRSPNRRLLKVKYTKFVLHKCHFFSICCLFLFEIDWDENP